MRSSRRLAFPVALVAAAGLLAGCGVAGGGSPSGHAGKPRATAAHRGLVPVGGDPAAEEPAAEEPAAQEPAGDVPAGAGGDDCLTGAWVADFQSVLGRAEDQMEQMFGADARLSVSGDVTTSFADGTISGTYDAFTMTIVASMDGSDVTAVMTFAGSTVASYTAADGVLAVGALDMSGLDLSYIVTADGQTMDLSNQFDDQLSAVGAVQGEASYTCDATTLTTVVSTATGEVAQVYHRR